MHLASSLPAMSQGGPIHILASESASSMGSSPSVRVKSWLETCWAIASHSMPYLFFWSQHYDVVINYVGHAEKWDAIEIEGDLDARDCAVTYKKGDRTLAVATISRDLQSLQIQAAMEAFSPARTQRVDAGLNGEAGTYPKGHFEQAEDSAKAQRNLGRRSPLC